MRADVNTLMVGVTGPAVLFGRRCRRHRDCLCALDTLGVLLMVAILESFGGSFHVIQAPTRVKDWVGGSEEQDCWRRGLSC